MGVDLNQVSIGIKTFLRDECLFNTVEAIRRTMPEVTMIIVDDGDKTEEKETLYAELNSSKHLAFFCDFDSGFGYKSNQIARNVETPYLLIGSDDFDFNPYQVRKGIEKLASVLSFYPQIDIASGRVNERPYEFLLEDRGDTIIEHPCYFSDRDTPYGLCDLTVNYNLVRSRVFDKIRWDDDVKIGGGEHGAFFVDVKRIGLKVGLVPGVNINEQDIRGDVRYAMYRRRANNPERPCFDRRGIKKYVCGNGQIDYEVK